MDAHDHVRGHDHRHVPGSDRRLVAAVAINVGFAVVQVVVGIATGSIVVLADAAHQVTDAAGLVIALVAIGLLRRPARGAMSFGFGKIDALGGYTSALLLIVSIGWIVVESIDRLRSPVAVEGWGVVAIGVAGIAVNGFGVWLVGHGHELSRRAARLHLAVDLAGSVIVVASGLVLVGTTATWIDPTASLVVAVLVIRGAVSLLAGSTVELLDRSPDDATPGDVVAVLAGHPGVTAVHHVHSRTTAPGTRSVTAHVQLDGSLSLHDAQDQLDALLAVLADELGVRHATLQLECHECADAHHD